MKARPADWNFSQEQSTAGLHACHDTFYRTTRDERQHRPGVIPLELLPRRCPVCGDDTIIGHGQRLRQAHDDLHASLRVRRGICPPCNKTFTILPDWLAPYRQYSLRCQQQADERIAAGAAIEQAAPHCKDPARLPDPSTLRRWAKWLLSMPAEGFFRIPTILAWDLGAFRRILPIEARSP